MRLFQKSTPTPTACTCCLAPPPPPSPTPPTHLLLLSYLEKIDVGEAEPRQVGMFYVWLLQRTHCCYGG